MTTTDVEEEHTAPARRQRSKRSLHPGVRFKKPNPAHRMPYWRGVFTDPDTNKEVYERLDSAAYPTKEARKQWAIRKSIEIRQRAADILDGGRRASGEGWESTISLYYENAPHLRDGTRETYETSTANFKKWAAETPGAAPDKLNRATLLKFRAWAMKLPKRRIAKGKKRGEVRELDARRSTFTVNGDLRVMRTVLGWLITAGHLPKLQHLDLTVALEKYGVNKDLPEYLSPREIGESIRAALRHDAALFTMTRDEKKRLGQRRDSEGGSTPRYKPIAPFVVCAFLTGMRLDEICLIEWRTHINLDATDFAGMIVGQIHLRAQDTKTKRARLVSFEISPLLRELFLALRRVGTGKGSVFGVSYDEAQEACQRIRDKFGAPDRFTYQMARSTCSTFLSNAPAIYGAAAPFHSAKQLGHSQKVAEDHYMGLVKGISKDVKTLESAMQVETEIRLVIDVVLGKITAEEAARSGEDPGVALVEPANDLAARDYNA